MKKLSLILCALAILAAVFSPLRAAAEDEVSIGYINYRGFVDKAEDGTLSGYAVEYFSQIAKITGWNCKFVDVSWSDAREQLLNGTLDFYCVARRTEQREADYDFSVFPLLNESMNLYFKIRTTRISQFCRPFS